MKILRKTTDWVFAGLESRDRDFSLLGASYVEGDVLVFGSKSPLELGLEMLVAPNLKAAQDALNTTPPPH